MYKWLVIVGLVIMVGVGGVVLLRNSSSSLDSQQVDQVVARVLMQPTPTPVLFAEMTVPGIRNKDFRSSLGGLNQFSNAATYISYLTNYTSDGLKINALITKPKGEMPQGGWPGIVFVHGYIAPSIYKTTEKYEAYVDYLARNGFVVFKIDLRGHGNSEGEAGGGYYSGDYIADVLNARAALQSSNFVNPDKIGLWGHSMAGNVVMRSLAAKPEIPAVAIWAGAVYSYSDLQKYGIDDNSYRPPENNTERQRKRKLLFDTHGEFSESSEFWKSVAPTNFLSDIKGAIEIHHAVDDSVVNIGFSRDLNSLLDKTNAPHELFEYSTGGHNITGPSFNTAMRRTVEFFKRHLE